MLTRDLYHGTKGDNILQIIRQGTIRPNVDGKIYFSERRFDSVLMHGADTQRKATFALKLRVTIPEAAILQQSATAGVFDALIVSTAMPLTAQVLELYVRKPRASTVNIVRGSAGITKYLST